MKTTTTGYDPLLRPWTGNCHSCDSQFVLTGQEVKEVRPGDEHSNIHVRDCPECGAKRKVYCRPSHVPTPGDEEPEPEDLPPSQEELEAYEAKLKSLVDQPFERAVTPGFIEVHLVWENWHARDCGMTGSRLVAIDMISEVGTNQSSAAGFGLVSIRGGGAYTTAESYETLKALLTAP